MLDETQQVQVTSEKNPLIKLVFFYSLFALLPIVGIFFLSQISGLIKLGLILSIAPSIITFIYFYLKVQSQKSFIKVVAQQTKILAQGKVLDSELEISTIDKNVWEELIDIEQNLKKIADRNKEIIAQTSRIAVKDFSQSLNLLHKEDDLAKSFNQMQDSLLEIATKDQEHKWLAMGRATLAEMLRKEYKTTEELCYNSLVFIINYVRANQGSIYVLNNDKVENQYLQLVGTYAYNKKKYLDETIPLEFKNGKLVFAEGLIGQVFLENEPVYLTDVPKDFLVITSGLGQATPKNIIIMPLKINDETNGVIELATFSPLNEVETEFVSKATEMLSAAISSIKIKVKTNHLLEASQRQTLELQEHEEEMRQNMEEMEAIQEELHRNQTELMEFKKNLEFEVRKQTSEIVAQKEALIRSNDKAIQKEKQVIAILNGMENAIFLTTEEGQLLIANETLMQLLNLPMSNILNMKYQDFFKADKIRMRKPFTAQLKGNSEAYQDVEATVNKLGVDGVRCYLFNLKLNSQKELAEV